LPLAVRVPLVQALHDDVVLVVEPTGIELAKPALAGRDSSLLTRCHQHSSTPTNSSRSVAQQRGKRWRRTDGRNARSAARWRLGFGRESVEAMTIPPSSIDVGIAAFVVDASGDRCATIALA